VGSGEWDARSVHCDVGGSECGVWGVWSVKCGE